MNAPECYKESALSMKLPMSVTYPVNSVTKKTDLIFHSGKWMNLASFSISLLDDDYTPCITASNPKGLKNFPLELNHTPKEMEIWCKYIATDKVKGFMTHFMYI